VEWNGMEWNGTGTGAVAEPDGTGAVAEA